VNDLNVYPAQGNKSGLKLQKCFSKYNGKRELQHIVAEKRKSKFTKAKHQLSLERKL
jgi:hypothetical protein